MSKKNIKIDLIINELSDCENIKTDIFIDYIKSFEKYIKSEIKKYDDKSGLEDYKMSKHDYNILYILYKNTTNTPYKIHILLLYIYSYYKLDGLCYNKRHFPFKLFFSFIKKNSNIHSLILQMIQNRQIT